MKQTTKQIKTNADRFGLSIDVIKELQKLEGKDVFVDGTSYNDEFLEKKEGLILMLTNNSEYALFKSYKEMEDEIRERIETDVFDHPETFDSDLIKNHMSVDEYAAYQIATNDAKFNISDDERNEIKDDVRDKLSDKKNDDDFEDQVKQLVDKRIQILIDDKVDELSQEIQDDPYEYFVTSGTYDYETLVKESFIRIDFEAIAQYLLDNGVENAPTFFARDDEYHKTPDEQYLVKSKD